MEGSPTECEKHKVRFKVELHRPGSSGDGDLQKVEGESGNKCGEGECFVHIDPSSRLSSLAPKFLQQLYEQGKVEGEDILKASNVKGRKDKWFIALV